MAESSDRIAGRSAGLEEQRWKLASRELQTIADGSRRSESRNEPAHAETQSIAAGDAAVPAQVEIKPREGGATKHRSRQRCR